MLTCATYKIKTVTKRSKVASFHDIKITDTLDACYNLKKERERKEKRSTTGFFFETVD